MPVGPTTKVADEIAVGVGKRQLRRVSGEVRVGVGRQVGAVVGDGSLE